VGEVFRKGQRDVQSDLSISEKSGPGRAPGLP
jgi:hypothetical protein